MLLIYILYYHLEFITNLIKCNALDQVYPIVTGFQVPSKVLKVLSDH